MTVDHANLANLDFASAGHTGFEPEHLDLNSTTTFSYNPDDSINTITTVEGSETITATYAYGGGGEITSITTVWTPEGKTKTATYSYLPSGLIDQIAVVWS